MGLNDNIYQVVYENLPSVCYSCGSAGHLTTACTPKGQEQPVNESQVNGQQSTEKSTTINTPMDWLVEKAKKKEFGEWMTVTRKKKQSSEWSKKQDNRNQQDTRSAPRSNTNEQQYRPKPNPKGTATGSRKGKEIATESNDIPNPGSTRTMENIRILPRSVRNVDPIKDMERLHNLNTSRKHTSRNSSSTFEFNSGIQQHNQTSTSNSFSALNETEFIDVEVLENNGPGGQIRTSAGYAGPAYQNVSNSIGSEANPNHRDPANVLALQGGRLLPGMGTSSGAILAPIESGQRGDGLGVSSHDNASNPTDCIMDGGIRLLTPSYRSTLLVIQ